MLQLFILIFVSVVILLLYDRYRRTTRLLMKIPGHKRLPLLGNTYHFMLPPGNRWRQRRKMLTAIFRFSILNKYSKIFIKQTNNFLKLLEAEVGKAETDLRPLTSRISLQITCETIMGSSISVVTESLMEKYFKAIEIMGISALARICRPWLYFDVFFKWSNLAYIQKQALSDLHSFTDQIITERREFLKNKKNIDEVVDDGSYGKKEISDLLDLLLENEKLGHINIKDVIEEVDSFMFGGHDTTAVALSYFIMAIANEPVIQEKIYEEMKNIFHNSQRSPTTQDLNEMTYLECCIKESLRLYPSAPIILRHITEELNLGGYTIPANTNYLILIYDLHRRADLYPEPERFIPERFLPENCSKRHPYAYIPFSAGPRNCMGQKFAMFEMKTLVSSLLRKFRVEPITKPSDLKYVADIMLRTHEQPINVRFCKRSEENITLQE